MVETTAVVVIGGLPIAKSVAKYLPKHDYVIAADSGLHSAIDLGLRVNLVVGDMDSVDPAVLVAAEVNGVTFYRVRVGPYGQLEDMNRVRSRLADNGVEASVVRQR